MAFATLSALLIVLLFWGKSAREPVIEFLGIGSGVASGRSATIRVLAVVVALALVLATDPEFRLLIMFVDAIGVDFFLLLLVVQGRALFTLLLGGVIIPLIQYMSSLGPYPLPPPSRWFLAQHPFWAVYAVAQLLAVASIVACLVAGAVVAGTSATTSLICKALSGSFLAGFRFRPQVRVPTPQTI